MNKGQLRVSKDIASEKKFRSFLLLFLKSVLIERLRDELRRKQVTVWRIVYPVSWDKTRQNDRSEAQKTQKKSLPRTRAGGGEIKENRPIH